MSSILKHKVAAYRSLASLLKAGVTFPVALEKNGRSPWLLPALKSIQAAFRAGNSVSETAAKHPTVFSPLEIGILAAGDRSGQLDYACEHLGSHFELLNRLRLQTRLQLGYPLFLASFAILSSGVPTLVEKGWISFAVLVVPGFALLLAALAVLALLFLGVSRGARSVPLIERVLLVLPFLGPLYRDWIAFRFASVYALCTRTGIPILETIRLCGPASQSAILERACETASREVLKGKTVGDILSDARILPDTLLPLWISGEESGDLDRCLEHWCASSVDELRSRTQAAVTFGTRAFGILVMLGIAWKIVASAKGYFDSLNQLMDF